MRIFEKTLAAGLAMLMLLGTGCGAPKQDAPDSGKVKIVATLFPQYDFARQIAGDKAEVTLLLPPGVESHSFEPTPSDIIKIDQADLFVYTGEYMEPWAKSITDGITGETEVLDISKNIPLDGDGDTHEDGHGHGEFDPHIWTSPLNAKLMVDNLTAALSATDPVNAAYYQANASAYKEELDALDAELEEIVENAVQKEIVFGGRFALHYFAQRYGLEYRAAFDSCSSETEPSARAVAEIIDEIRTKQLPAIFHEELTDPKAARSIAEETGVKLLLLHSCHNVSKEEMQNGATYLSLMRQNGQNLKVGLN